MSGTWLTLVIACVVFAVAMAAMAVGVIIGNRQLRGSCGGLAGLRDEHGNTLCEACTSPAPECQGEPLEQEAKHSAPTETPA